VSDGDDAIKAVSLILEGMSTMKELEPAFPMNLLLARELSTQEEDASAGGGCIAWNYYVTGVVDSGGGAGDPVIDAYCIAWGTYT